MNNNLISRQIEKYISYKKALGYQIKIESQELRRFASYTVSIGYEGSLTKDIAFQWATLKPNYSQWYMARRMETIRTFAKYISVFDPMAQIPPNGMFGKCHGRTTPYIFTEQEICILMQASLNLYAPDGLRCKTISTAIGLLWSTGMRPNEVCQLMDDDVDLNDGLITIRETKFSKSRIIPIHETAISKLRSYVNDRDNLRRDFSDLHFLITTGSRKLVLRNFESALQVIRDQILIDKNEWDRRPPPRLYDFRHTFACNTLLRWLNNGINIDRKIIYLSTYLGHVKVADTYWYLTGTPELLQLTSRNFEEFFYEGGVSDEK
ncbi:mobile element protein [Gracilibacillus boraciitolerans JCM 21714]|uniref:Mobile element protein n=1 Tax=Gracilibacillus boraciitolerans JCM 21714 TaxID=1298598 RepID=W4VPR8_9BACI|nr:tyrosine-type recombinase/integrase [Gracilibacillus boraciitolerans]GAE95360.1 mobile element protein [Gracilibacillus boraciitolerans JCM 21714]